MTAIGLQGLASVLLVLGLVAALAWFVRRGLPARFRPQPKAIAIETAVPLGDRRSLVVVNVEGRRLLLGLTPAQVSMVAELSRHEFDATLESSR